VACTEEPIALLATAAYDMVVSKGSAALMALFLMFFKTNVSSQGIDLDVDHGNCTCGVEATGTTTADDKGGKFDILRGWSTDASGARCFMPAA
jgi:hypothetical protein